jgi:Zn-dependent protease
MTPIELVIYLAILLFSVIFHEVAHGLMADRLGDPTARHAGRLTLNPIPHIDLLWSILLPAVLIMSGSPIVFGAAKPVPVDFRNLRNLKRDMFLVAIVGPLTNLALAVLAALTYRMTPHLSDTAAAVLLQTVILNLVLAIFNLIPIPPLDGSKVLASIIGFFNREFMHVFLELEKYGFIFLILVLLTGILDKILFPPVNFIFNLLIKF